MNEPSYILRVDADKAGLRLDRMLARAMPAVSRSRLKGLIEAGRVQEQSTGLACAPARRVREGEVYRVHMPAPEVGVPAAQAIPLDVVFEDEHLIVVEKPPGLVTHPGAGNPDHTLVNALIAHCGSLSAIGAPLRPGIVHRLDKDTSGLLVAAKTDAAHIALAVQFARHTIERRYHALVWGVPASPAGRIDLNIGRDPRTRVKMAAVVKGGKDAATDYRVLDVFGNAAAALLECRPLTGRTHQIRVHLAAIGHPIVGDVLYGGGNRRGRDLDDAMRTALAAARRQALHAFLIGFLYPHSEEWHTFQRPLFMDIRELIGSLKPM